MKAKHGLAFLITLLIAPFAATARAFAPKGTDALNTQGTHDGGLTRTAEVALSAHLLLTWGTSPGTQLKLNTAATRPLGTAYDDFEAGAKATLLPLLAGPSRTMIGSKAIAAGVRVYGTAGGKVTDAVVAGAYLVGEAWTACTGDGAEFEVIPLSPVVNP
jgi:hypothetical protein